MRLKKYILYGETFFLLIGRGVLSVEGYPMVLRIAGEKKTIQVDISNTY
jgi:hypothetical protein